MAAAVVAFGGWVGQAVVQNVVDTVSSYLKDHQIVLEPEITTALDALKAALLPIQVSLELAEKMELNLHQNPRLGEWIWQLRDAIAEAEDVLDDIEYYRLEDHVLKRDAEELGAATSSKFKSPFRKVGASCSKYVKIDTGPTLDKINAAVDKLKLVKEDIDVLNSVVSNSQLLLSGKDINTGNSRETGYLLVDEVVGRDEEKMKVLQLLRKSEGDRQGSTRISALTIWGVGGLGKTTLAQSIYNDDSLYFQVKMWVCVSNNSVEMLELMKKAIESATNKPPKATIMPSLQEELKNIVDSNKCLLVLDDVWDGQVNQNRLQWGNFIGVLSRYAKAGSWILITSRMKNVAEIVLQGLPNTFFPLACLQEDKALSLFYKHAFVGVNHNKHANLKPVGKIIAKKCGGLPLALKMIGGLLSTKRDLRYWLSVSEKNILILEHEDVKKVLNLSYRCLPSNLQACFKICSLFPQDYKFKKNELVTLWMGLECINQCINEKLAEHVGLDYLDELVRRSFFVLEGGFYIIHDLLHDLARDVSQGECLRVEGNKSVTLPKTLCHLFVVDQLNSDLVKEISGLKRLRTLALNYNYDENFSPKHFPDYGEHYGILKQLTSLHALFLSSKTMPSLSVIEELKHLRLFHLKVRTLNQHFTPLSKLYHLQNLRCEEYVAPSEVYNVHQQIVCDGIGNLVKLRHLVLPSRIFDQIAQLRYLIELQEVELTLSEDNVFKLSDLKDLNRLCHLNLTCEREITKLEEAEEARIEKKEHLETLSLSLNGPNHDFQLQEQLCNYLKPRIQSKITNLEVVNYSGVKAPSWMTSHYLPYVTHLKLSEWENLEHLPTLGQLPSLKVLTLKKIAGVKQLSSEFFGRDDIGGFPSLEELRMKKMENWEEWTRVDDTNWFPCLKEIHIENCQKLQELPALPVCLKKLKLESVGLVALPTWHDIDEHEMSTSKSNTPVLKDLMIQNCQKLMNVQLLLSKCIGLEKLYIKDCKSLKELPALPLSLKELTLELVGLIALPAWHDVNDNEASPSLVNLDIYNCEELVYVQPFLRKCAFLKELSIVECPQIFNPNQVTSSICLDLFDGLSSLTTLELRDFAGIRTLHCLKGLSLEDLTIQGCQNLISLDCLQALKSLDYLSITECDHLITSSSAESFDQTHSPSSFHVKILNIDNILLLQIEPLRSIKSVKELRVHCDDCARCLPHQWLLQNHTSLESLRIWECPVLESVPDELPSSLTKLEIQDCPQLKSLPESMPSSLKMLLIHNCPLMELLPDNISSSLEHLMISKFELLKSLPERTPSSLKKFDIFSCPLVELLPNSILSSLEHLRISGCPLLEERYKRDGGSDWHKIAHVPNVYMD